MHSPLHGQEDVGAIWDRTVNEYMEGELHFVRSHLDPCGYTTIDGRIVYTFNVDDWRLFYYEGDKKTKDDVGAYMHKLMKHFNIDFGPEDPSEDYLLGDDRIISKDREIATTLMTIYNIELMVDPADDSLQSEWKMVVSQRSQVGADLMKQCGALFGSLLHAAPYRPVVAAIMSLLGRCLTFRSEDMYRRLTRGLVYPEDGHHLLK